jgi:spore coat-associated protein N
MVNKKIILSVLIIGGIIILMGSGTWAFFTSDATTNGDFTVGNLSIGVNGQLGDNNSTNYILPGDTITNNTIQVTNNGNYKIGKIKVTFKLTGNDSSLGNNITFSSVTIDNNVLVGQGTLSDLIDKDDIIYTPETSISPGDKLSIIFNGLKFNDNAGDSEKNKKLNLLVQIKAFQKNNQ